MAIICTTRIVGNEEAARLVGQLDAIGIPRHRIHLLETETAPEHGTDAYSTWNLMGGCLGAVIGASLGWLVMIWSAIPWVGAVWGAAVGSITGARYGGYAVADSATTEDPPPLPATVVEIEAMDEEEARRIRELCGPECRSETRADDLIPGATPEPASRPG